MNARKKPAMNSFSMYAAKSLRLLSLTACLLAFLVTNVLVAEDITFGDLNLTVGANEVRQEEEGKTLALGSYTIEEEGAVLSHNYFERKLDSPPFYNFVSHETNNLLGFQRTNGGTCFGISMVTMRYFQWFILPSLLSDEDLQKVRGKKYFGFGPPKTKRKLPAYARKMAQDFNLPDWILQWPEGSQKERAKRVAPYRLRAYLTTNKPLAQRVEGALKTDEMNTVSNRLDPDIAKEHSVRMFDNQMGLMRKGSQLYEMLNRKLHDLGDSDDKTFKALFGRCAFDQLKKQIEDDKYGCTEFGFWSSKMKNIWGHSVVAFMITEHAAENTTTGEAVKAYKVHLYDNNDPSNHSDAGFWYFSDAQKFAPTKGYADMYDGDNPLLPVGQEYMNSVQLGPSTDTFMLRFEENTMNKFSFKMETVTFED